MAAARGVASAGNLEAVQRAHAAAGVRQESDTFGPIAVPADRAVGRADAAVAGELPTLAAASGCPLPVVRAHGGQVKRCGGARSTRGSGLPDGRHGAMPSWRRRRKSSAGALDGPVPAGRLADGLGHADQHERQRGDRQPRRAAAGGRTAGAKSAVHPNDHVNLSQSSNDAVPERRCMSPWPRSRCERAPAAGACAELAWRRSTPGRADVGGDRQDRPHAHCRTPRRCRWGRSSRGTPRRFSQRHRRADAPRRWASVRALALGGTAVGTGLNAPRGFRRKLVAAEHRGPDGPCRSPRRPNKFEALACA
jgi:fumarate hydratase class II